MTKLAEAKLIEFLTDKNNLPYVLDILRIGNKIRKPILWQFWKNLYNCLRKIGKRAIHTTHFNAMVGT